MIRKFRNSDLDDVMQIWLYGNIDAHYFIDKDYWKNNFDMVSEMIPKAEVYVFEDKDGIAGFIGLMDNYIAGLFVKHEKCSNGIGKHLLDYAKTMKEELQLDVYSKNKKALDFYIREGFEVKNIHVNEETNEEEKLMEGRGRRH